MLTIFGLPKPFRGHTGVIQRNAIRSWAALRPRPEILLFGDEEGTAEMALEVGAVHVPEIERSAGGVPLVGPMFDQAEGLASNPLLCYVNADILLPGAFPRAVEAVAKQRGPFLMVGRRWLLDLEHELDFGEPWEKRLAEALPRARLDRFTAVDYFLYRRGTYPRVPPFAIGRFTWDNWLVGHVRLSGHPVIDATRDALVIHQNHDYAHAGGHREASWGEEAMRNRALAGATPLCTIADATHVLVDGKLRPARGPAYAWRRVYRWSGRHRAGKPLRRAMDGAIRTARRVLDRTEA